MVVKDSEEIPEEIHEQILKGIWRHVLSDVPNTMAVEAGKNR